MTDTKEVVSTEKEINEVLDKFVGDYHYDVHGLRIKYSRSNSAKQLVAIGRPALRLIANFLTKTFSITNDKDNARKFKNGSDYLYIFFIYLITDIIEAHKIPNKPYAKNVTYGDQEIKVWRDYCLDNST